MRGTQSGALHREHSGPRSFIDCECDILLRAANRHQAGEFRRYSALPMGQSPVWHSLGRTSVKTIAVYGSNVVFVNYLTVAARAHLRKSAGRITGMGSSRIDTHSVALVVLRSDDESFHDGTPFRTHVHAGERIIDLGHQSFPSAQFAGTISQPAMLDAACVEVGALTKPFNESLGWACSRQS